MSKLSGVKRSWRTSLLVEKVLDTTRLQPKTGSASQRLFFGVAWVQVVPGVKAFSLV